MRISDWSSDVCSSDLEARDQARTAARESSETAHALALTLESQRTQVAALSQSLARMGSQRGQLDSRLGELATQLATGAADPAVPLEPQRQAVLEPRVVAERALGTAHAALAGIDQQLPASEHARQQLNETGRAA